MIRDLIGLIIGIAISVFLLGHMRSCQRCEADGGAYVAAGTGYACVEKMPVDGKK